MNKFWAFKMLENNKEADLTLYGEISDTTWWGDEITPKQFSDDLKALGDVDTINVHINSMGGDVFAGQAIYNSLKSHKAKINVYVDGIAASTASLIAMAGDKVIMPKNTLMMIHNPWTITKGDSEDLRKTADILDKVRETIVACYQDKCKKPKNEIIKIMKNETYLTADEAVSLGFADEIKDYEVEMSINGVKMSINSILPKFNKNNIQSNEDILDTNLKGEQKMPETNVPKAEQPKNEAPKIEAPKAEVPKAGVSKEDTLAIMNLCEHFKMDAKEFIKKEFTLEQVNAAILDKLVAKNPPIANNNIDCLQVTADEADKFKDCATDGLLMRAGVKLQKTADGANDFRGMRLRDLAVEAVMRTGQTNVHRMDDNRLFKAALTPDSQFASILSNAVNKTMAKAYNAAVPTFTAWVGTGSNPDFKTATHYQISEAGDLKQMTQQGEFQFDEATDRGVSKSIATFGRSFGFTRQAMINDDLSVLTKIPQTYVRAAIRGINKLVYKKLADTSLTIFDGKALFHSDHGNLGSAAALSVTSLGAARKAMRKQMGLRSKEYLNIVPQFLLLPPGQEVTALQLLKSMSDPAATNSNVVNPFQNSLTVIVDAELDQYDEYAWYLAASPADIDTIEVTYLNGQEMPTLESEVQFDYLGIKWRIYIDYGVTVLDYKGFYKNPNTQPST